MSYTIEQMREWPRVPHKWLDINGYIAEGLDIGGAHKKSKQLYRDARKNDGPGVYCAWNKDRLAYIGYSKTMAKRVNCYWMWDFPGEVPHFTGLRCETPEEAAALEADLIEIHKPIQNFRKEPKGGQVRGRKRAA